jgi:HlyD family secretion protein
MKSNRLRLLLPLVLLLPFLLPACRRAAGGAIRASGHVEATEVRLAAKVGGKLLEAPLQEGDAVAADGLVARFDCSDAAHELKRARAERDAADARLRLLLAGSREEDVRKGSEELARSKVELEAASADLVRLDGLALRGTATTKSADDARARRDSARRSVEMAKAALDRLVKGARREEIEVARAQKEGAEAQIESIQQRIDDAVVRSPGAFVVTHRLAEPGEILPPGSPVAVLTDLAHPWLNVWIDEPSLGRIRVGDSATVRVDGRSESFAGKIVFVSPVAEFTPKNVQTPDERAKLVYRLKIALDDRTGIFKPGMPAEAELGASAAGK